MKHVTAGVSLVAVVLSLPAQAQVATDQWSEAQAQIAFTVPLGRSPRTAETEPRIELLLRQRPASGEFAALRRADDARWNERRIGVSLGDHRRMMLNGREIVREDRKDGVSDGVWIAGGVVVVSLLVGGLLFFDALNDSSE